MDHPINNCQNCGNEYEDTQKFCAACGQETKLSKLTLRELFINLFHTVFNYDNTLFNTIKIIFKPWAYTQHYIAGKRKTYMNPVRIFIVLMLVYVGLLISNLHINNITAKKMMEIESELLTIYNQTISTFDLDDQDCHQLDTLKRAVFTSALMINDTSYAEITEIGITDYKVTQYEAAQLTPEEIIKKHNITNFFHQRILTQYLKIKDEQEGGAKFAISNIVWGVCGAIFLLAGLFKLLYIRGKRFYIEHIILILNVHVITIFIAIVVALLFKIFGTETNDFVSKSIFTILIVFPIFMFLALHYYYRQPLWKTFFKYIFILLNYVSFGLIIIVLTSLVSLLFY